MYSKSRNSAAATIAHVFHTADAVPALCITPTRDCSDSTSQTCSVADTLVAPLEDELFDIAYDNFSCTSHMGLLDHSYSTFTSIHGAVLYQVQHRTMVIFGDPMCHKEHLTFLLAEVKQFCRAQKLRMAFMGVSRSFAVYTQDQKWLGFKFGTEKTLNTATNPILRNGSGKRILSQNRHLLDPKRGGVKISLYAPSVTGVNRELEDAIQHLYDDWRRARDTRGAQTFVTVYDLFFFREKTMFLYATLSGKVLGMAMLRYVGARDGFHIDPCIASHDAPRGVSDMLIVMAMQMLDKAGVTQLSLGLEPARDLQVLRGGWYGPLARGAYRKVANSTQLSGKTLYNSKFHPDEGLDEDVFVVFPGSAFPLRQVRAVMEVAHIRQPNILNRR